MKPVPAPSRVTAAYWEAAREGRLLVRRCNACGALSHPPRPLCPACWSSEVGWLEASGRGSIVSVTVVHHPPQKAFETPYVLAVVRLDEGPQMMTNIVGADAGRARIGRRVRVTFEARGDLRLPQFELD